MELPSEKPHVFQTKFGKNKGNCLAACVSYMLDIPLDLIDSWNMQAAENGYEQLMILSKKLEKLGYGLIQLDTSTADNATSSNVFFQGAGYYIASGYKMVDGEPILHSVVYQNHMPVNDPHEGWSGTFDSPIQEFIIIYKLNPSVNIQHYCDSAAHKVFVDFLNMFFNSIDGLNPILNYTPITSKSRLNNCLSELIYSIESGITPVLNREIKQEQHHALNNKMASFIPDILHTIIGPKDKNIQAVDEFIKKYTTHQIPIINEIVKPHITNEDITTKIKQNIFNFLKNYNGEFSHTINNLIDEYTHSNVDLHICRTCQNINGCTGPCDGLLGEVGEYIYKIYCISHNDCDGCSEYEKCISTLSKIGPSPCDKCASVNQCFEHCNKFKSVMASYLKKNKALVCLKQNNIPDKCNECYYNDKCNPSAEHKDCNKFIVKNKSNAPVIEICHGEKPFSFNVNIITDKGTVPLIISADIDAPPGAHGEMRWRMEINPSYKSEEIQNLIIGLSSEIRDRFIKILEQHGMHYPREAFVRMINEFRFSKNPCDSCASYGSCLGPIFDYCPEKRGRSNPTPPAENVCEHGDHPAPAGQRFCSEACCRCDSESTSDTGCDNICGLQEESDSTSEVQSNIIAVPASCHGECSRCSIQCDSKASEP